MGAGGEGGSSNQIWSHVSSFPALNFDGVEISRYSIQPEIKSSGVLETIGTICHEHGHVLGLPDLYDINYTSKPAPVGKYCIMASGSSGGNPMGSTPAHMSAWCKTQVGFADLTEITTPGTYTVNDVNTHATGSAYTIAVPDSLESFLVTNRWMDAPIQFAGMPARFKGGLLIYHVDDTYDFSNDGRTDFWHVVIEDAVPGDGYDLANGGFAAGVNDNFGRFTDPNTDGNHHPSGITVYDVTAMGEQMSFKVAFSPVMLMRDYQLISLGGNRYALNVTLENVSQIAANNLVLDIATDATNVTFEVSHLDLGTVAANSMATTGNSFVFQTTDNISSFETVTITSTGTDFQGKPIPITIPINPAKVLLVDDDNTKGAASDVEQYWMEGLDPTGIEYQVWETWTLDFPASGMLNAYDLVIWCDGTSTQTVPKHNGNGLEIIEQYLDAGGDLIWSSQEFLYSEYPMKGDDDDHFLTEPGDFAREYLHILELEHDEYFYNVTGVPGTFTDGMNLGLVDMVSGDPTGQTEGEYNWWPDEFLTDGTCIPILTSNGHEWPYPQTGDYYDYFQDDLVDDVLVQGTCAMVHQGQHRLMFMAAPLHGITTDPAASPNTRQEFLRDILNWFGVSLTEPGLDIDVNDPEILAGDTCHVTLKLFNPGTTRSVNTFIAMEAYGDWFFGPGWTTEATFYPMDIESGTTTLDVFPAFEWPSGAGAGHVTFWSVMLDGGTGNMLGNYDYTPLTWM